MRRWRSQPLSFRDGLSRELQHCRQSGAGLRHRRSGLVTDVAAATCDRPVGQGVWGAREFGASRALVPPQWASELEEKVLQSADE